VSVTAAPGFVAAGGAVGIKAGGAPDLAVVATDDGRPVAAAGVFTANLAPAAPVEERIRAAAAAEVTLPLAKTGQRAPRAARPMKS